MPVCIFITSPFKIKLVRRHINSIAAHRTFMPMAFIIIGITFTIIMRANISCFNYLLALTAFANLQIRMLGIHSPIACFMLTNLLCACRSYYCRIINIRYLSADGALIIISIIALIAEKNIQNMFNQPLQERLADIFLFIIMREHICFFRHCFAA